MKLNEIFSGDYLKAEDLQGRNARVWISDVTIKDFDDGKKLILHFKDKEKCLVCNKTNASIIEEVLGSGETDDWIGKAITLITKKVEFQGKLVPAIRVLLEEQRKPEPKPVSPADQDGFDPDLPSDSDIPF